MLKFNFKYELKFLLRSRWIQMLYIILFIVFGFSIFNGKEKADKIKNTIVAAEIQVKENDVLMLKLIDSIEKGYKVSVPRWTVPTNPMAIGNYHPRVAAMKPLQYSFISIGQADLYTSYIKPTVSADDYALNFTEMTSPIQLLFGSFDLAFVIVYLIPLLIIAFSFNVLSSEKEIGTLRLISSQPVQVHIWLLQKLGLRFFWLSILLTSSMTIVLLIISNEFFFQPRIYISLIALILVYMFFWFVLAFFINIWVGNSANNAVALIGLWIIFVLLVPSLLNQLGSTIYPMPSRTLMINEMRAKKLEVTEKQDEILDNFLRDHPEYAVNDPSQTNSFYHKYIASQKLIKEEMKPIVNTFENQLKNQQQLIRILKWISPALIIQETLNKLAGNSTDDYESYRIQVINFSETWREYLTAFLFNNLDFSVNDYTNLPKFEMSREKFSTTMSILILLLISLCLLIPCLIFFKKDFYLEE